MNKEPYPNQAGPKLGKIKTYPQRKLKPAVKDEMGIMGSSMEQAKRRKEKALLDMRKRGMLRKKQGQ